MSLDAFEVIGGQPLSGEITPQGAKNEALQILCATLLTDEPVVLSNLPNILDVNRLLELLRGLNIKVEQLSDDTYQLQAKEVDLDFFQSDSYRRNASRIRGSVMLIAPLLARYGKAFLPKPGGDKIGRRRLDAHFIGLQALGAQFNYEADKRQYFIEAERLRGTYLLMDEISVTGTANVVMAAVLAEGT
ncbi:MAG TPA: hypothetical protein VJ933_12215, partial [Phaeodactylibacter sp.]|nr:hypothetical protein [Phaeodactylibacter sp.]